MSRKNTREAKAKRRLRKEIKVTTPKGWIDLVHWLKMRQRMSTRVALLIIDAGWVVSESHPLRSRFVPADLRGTIEIRKPKDD